MRLFITSSVGFSGVHLTERLLREGHAVAFARATIAYFERVREGEAKKSVQKSVQRKFISQPIVSGVS